MNQLAQKWESLRILWKSKLQFIFRARSFTWTVQSAYLPLPKAKIPDLWEEFYPKSSKRRQIPVWWDKFFLNSYTIRFEQAVAAHSFLEVSYEWKSKSGILALLFSFSQKYMASEEQRWNEILSEFSDYSKNPRAWNLYLRFPLFRKNLFPANDFEFDWCLVWSTQIPFAFAKEFPLGEAIPASFEKSDARLTILHCHLTKAKYHLYEENFETNVWLRDYFLEVQSKDSAQESTKSFLYVGSDYSHLEIEKKCTGMKLYRKKLNLDIRIQFNNPSAQITFKEQTNSVQSWHQSKIQLNPGSRLSTRNKVLRSTEFQPKENNYIFLITKGTYNLDPKLMDLNPIDFHGSGFI
ncbi:MAG: hypothetical protein MH321_16235 [Leptospiraceae bacterium]|nr:hypothetical protein [Leptospiraceae bacterium]